jgi:hypothetical protein
MNNENLKQLFWQAEGELNSARQELYHPSFDVVNYSVCINARSALYRFLQCLYIIYTDENKENREEALTLNQLLEYCLKYDKQLKDSDFSHINCIHMDVRKENEEEFYYCNDTCKVQQCTDTADYVRNLVIEKAWDSVKSD